MRRMRAIAAGAACLFFMSAPALAHERCGCRDGGEVLNGRLNTADFDGGVGDRFGDGGTTSGGYVIVSGGESSSAFAGASSGAYAAAHASAYARASVATHFGGGHGGGSHGGHGGSHW